MPVVVAGRELRKELGPDDEQETEQIVVAGRDTEQAMEVSQWPLIVVVAEEELELVAEAWRESEVEP